MARRAVIIIIPFMFEHFCSRGRSSPLQKFEPLPINPCWAAMSQIICGTHQKQGQGQGQRHSGKPSHEEDGVIGSRTYRSPTISRSSMLRTTNEGRCERPLGKGNRSHGSTEIVRRLKKKEGPDNSDPTGHQRATG